MAATLDYLSSSQFHPFRLSFTSRLLFPSPSLPRLQQSISCTKSKRDPKVHADLSSALSIQTHKLKALAVEREEAMKKSRQLLFSELCGFAGLSPLDMKLRWTMKMVEEDKLVLLTDFVSEWGTNFHPLSVRSIGEMIEQYLADQVEEVQQQSGHGDPSFSSSSSPHSGWRNLLPKGFLSKKLEE